MDLRYPFVIVGALLLILLYFIFVRKKRHKYSSGSKIANTFFLKNTDYYKRRLRNYKIFRRLLLALFVVAIFAATVLIARPYETIVTVEEKYNRDIILCMDKCFYRIYILIDYVIDYLISLLGCYQNSFALLQLFR